jgi:peptidyl-prolyl cis-trans isomerase SurA
MEEKKTPAETAETNPQVDLMDKEPIADAMEATPGPVDNSTKTTRSLKLTIISVVVVVVALAGILYALERDGRVDSNVFSGMIGTQEAQSQVAVVNGEVITESELAVASTQLAQAAAAQGADPADPAIQASIRSQALDLIIGTTLLTQQAEAEGVTVTDQEVAERLAAIEADAGGAEILADRMAEFGISRDALESDVRSELIISKLLDTLVTSEDISVTEEEIVSAYEGAGAPGVDLPPLEDVRSQIEAQLQQVSGEALIQEYVEQLRTDADIEIN